MSEQNFKDWETPAFVIETLEKRLITKHFEIDVAASPTNAKANKYLTKEDNGLTRPWSSRESGFCTYAWCNPPYQNIIAWLNKAIQETENNVHTTMLLPASTDTKWFHQARKSPHCDIGFIEGRIRFFDSRTDSIGRSPAIGNILVQVAINIACSSYAQLAADAVSEAIKVRKND